MCQATAYLLDSGHEQNIKIMEDVVLVEPKGESISLTGLLGERKSVQGRLKSIDFLKHVVLLQGAEQETRESKTRPNQVMRQRQ
ncbi:MAG TPA: RNA-binding protein [Chloroflexi bacterium]|nr:RNA-binding protein [Chloroflexota bacterium]